MKRYLLVLALVFAAVFANAQIIDAQLLEELNRRSDDEQLEVIVIMKARYDRDILTKKAASCATRAERRALVINELKTFAMESQKDLMAFVGGGAKSLWSSNSLCFSATKSQIMEIANRNDVAIIGLDRKELVIPEIENGYEPQVMISKEQNDYIAVHLTQVNATEAWEQGYTGAGVIIAVIDSGVNYNHLDLADHMWDGGEAFPHHGYDIVNDDDDPMDDKWHGTHCAGIACGDGNGGRKTGVAPDAILMAIKSIDADGYGGVKNITAGMEWAVEHGCDVISMSLGMVNTTVVNKEMFRRTCVAINDVGIPAAVCTGNEGHLQYYSQIPNNVRVPGSCPPPYLDPDQLENPGELSCVISVGAVDGSNDEAAYFTSQGPVTWQDTEFSDYAYEPGIGLIRPDVSAPGVEIESLYWEIVNGYWSQSGTSQATPIVGGIIALMLQKNPELKTADICRILEESSVRLTPHKSNLTGVGRVDALAAVNMVGHLDVDENHADEITVYPNPAKDYIHINNSLVEMRFIASQIEIMDINGQLMDINVKNNQIDVSNLPNGMYLLKIGDYYEKIVIQH